MQTRKVVASFAILALCTLSQAQEVPGVQEIPRVGLNDTAVATSQEDSRDLTSLMVTFFPTQ